MIILGEKYTFTKLELEKLRKKFGQVNFLSHENSDAKALRSALENLIKSGKKDRSSYILRQHINKMF